MIEPKPPAFTGTMPISCGGIRSAASMSSRLMFLIEPNSSLAATSLTGMSWMPSFLPLGE
ncbi:hypothetical protein FQZ97_1050960 [compost metagenome]